ncbi:MAG: pyridoxal phosphate-dependent aminotransferase [Caldilineaceae bacterium]|nr:pyridoxal phosphate-dependent aminotransferase [Caldilineaceae bacterium]
MSAHTQQEIPGEPVDLTELRRVANDGTALRYALMELAAETPDVIALGRGDPDMDTPEHIIAAAQEAVRSGLADRPAPPSGLPELRAAIAEKLRRDNNIPADDDCVLVTSGGQEALFLIMQALLNPGDEVLVPDPRYTSYDQAIEQAGGKMVMVGTEPEDDFDLLPAAVEAALTPRTKALLIVSPNNPTGGVVSEESRRAIAELAKQHDFIVISDEIYEKFVYPPARRLSMAALPDMFERTITLNGVSKAYCMTGWRVGYVAAPPDFIAALTTLKTATTGPTAAVGQYAALAAIAGPQDAVDAFYAIYAQRRQLLMEGLTAIGLTYSEPQGGFFVYTNAASSGLSAFELSYRLLKEGHVLIFPGTAFGEKWRDWLRISYLQPAEELQKALWRMEAVLGRLKREG